MVHIVFHEVVVTGEKSGKCGCGKRRVRRQRFYQTVNPFNLNAAGIPKSVEEIRSELRIKRDAWKLLPIFCENCKSGKVA